jgi:hypothetical protein
VSRRALALAGIAACVVTPLAAQLRGVELRAGAVAAVSRRNAAFNGGVGTGSGTMMGIDLVARTKWVGLEIRTLGGEFTADSGTSAAGTVANGDIRLALGPKVIAAEVGYGRRGFTGAVSTVTWSFVRVGARASMPIGGSGFTAGVVLAIYTGVARTDGGGSGSGTEIETSLTYQPPRLPGYLLLGYRREAFTAEGTGTTYPEEIGALLVGGGVRLGR